MKEDDYLSSGGESVAMFRSRAAGNKGRLREIRRGGLRTEVKW